MTSGFEKHGLKHTSASQINMWADAPCAWIAKYLYGKRFSFGVAPQIGILTEKVVADVLTGSSLEDAVETAEGVFKKDNALNTSAKDVERVSNIKDMAEQALSILKEYGEPEFANPITKEQKKIELTVPGDGWQLPLIGYLDFVYPKHGLVIDLKTTLRCPTFIRDPHARQAAVYSKAMGNYGVKFLYVTPKKSNMLDLEDAKPYLDQVRSILNRQEKFLRKLNKAELRECVPVNTSTFYWTGDEDIRKELYGL